MSSKRGNVHRSRPQKYQNTSAFKNDLHDKSIQTKRINNIQVSQVCEKCKKVIEWKIKYKKFKTLKAPKTCVGCNQRNIKHSYHTLCSGCANARGVCPKCALKEELVPKEQTLEEQLQLDREMQNMLKSLPERKRRTFLRYVQKKKEKKRKKKENEGVEKPAGKDNSNPSDDGDSDLEDKKFLTKDDLLAKLSALKLSCKNDGSDDDEWDSEFDDDDLEDDDSDDCESDDD